jgi:hypothetical protein
LYNLVPDDFTHLNVDGSIFFGSMVSLLLTTIGAQESEFASLGKWFQEWTLPNATVVEAIETGVFYFP